MSFGNSYISDPISVTSPCLRTYYKHMHKPIHACTIHIYTYTPVHFVCDGCIALAVQPQGSCKGHPFRAAFRHHPVRVINTRRTPPRTGLHTPTRASFIHTSVHTRGRALHARAHTHTHIRLCRYGAGKDRGTDHAVSLIDCSVESVTLTLTLNLILILTLTQSLTDPTPSKS